MSNLVEHAKRELDGIGMTENSADEINHEMRKHLLSMVEKFSEAEHSGSSARYALGVLAKLLAFEPLAPLTGADDEWTEVYDGTFQNKRCSRVFKDSTGTYDSAGRIFEDPDGGRWQNADSRVYITFPYTPTQEIVKRASA